MDARKAQGAGCSRGRRKSLRSAALGTLLRRVAAAGAFFAVGAIALAVAGASLVIDGHTFEYLGVTYNSDGTSTWTYQATSGTKPSMAYWVLELDSGLFSKDNVLSCSEGREVKTDHNTGLYGLKFGSGYRDGEGRIVSFTLDRWYREVPTRIGTKTTNDIAIGGPITGPGPAMERPNSPPVAADDRATTAENSAIAVNVLANDADSDGTLARGTVSITRSPALGTVSLDTITGAVTFTPFAGRCGTDEFRYTVADDDGAWSNEAAVQLTIVCNLPPAAADDAATTDESTAVAIPVLGNDRDSDGKLDASTVLVVRRPGFGSCDVHPTTGVVTYTPAVGSCGDDVFEYTVRDDDGAVSPTARVTVSVLCSDPPLAVDDLYNVAEGASLGVPAIGVLANDKETPGRSLRALLLTSTAHGRLDLREDGSFSYVHDGTETRDDAFTYVADDGRKSSNMATVRLVVAPTNDEPSAADDRAGTREDEPVQIDVLANDSDPDGDALAVDWVGTPTHGRAANLGTRIVYTPDADSYGADEFPYGVADGRGGTARAVVRVEVAAVNDVPDAQPDSSSTLEDVSVVVDVLANDRDPDGDALAVIGVTQPQNGSAETDGRRITYIPALNWNGNDSFTYSVSDGQGGTTTAIVTVSVTPVNDPPLAAGGEVTTDEDTALDIDVAASAWDPDGDSLQVGLVSVPAHGTATLDGATVRYMPDADFFGDDAFDVTIADGRGGTARATIIVHVLPVNDLPLAQDDSAATGEGVSVEIRVLMNDHDPDGDALVVQSTAQPAHGSTRTDGATVTYTPASGFHGADAFTYTVADGRGGTASARVIVDVATSNRAPIVAGGHVTANQGEAIVIAVLQNDADPDGDPLVLESVSLPAHGALTRSGNLVTYTPDRGFHGDDAFGYTASDGRGGTGTGVITITVLLVNTAPIARGDSVTTLEDTPVSVDVLGNDADPDGDMLAIAWATQPSNGSTAIAGSAVLFTPQPGFVGTDEFTYGVSDGRGGTSEARVLVAVEDVNDDPVAADDAAATLEDVPVSISVLLNDTDSDGDALVIESVSPPAHGTAVLAGAAILYTPASEFSGDDAFSYAIADGRGGRASARVTLRVAVVNDAPQAQDDSTVTEEDTAVRVDVLQNDYDVDGDPLGIQSVSQPGHGAVTHDGASVIYTPALGWSGTDEFTYTAADGRGGAATARVSITVRHVNHDPVAQDDSAVATSGQTVTIEVLSNDFDWDGDFLLVQAMSDPANGTVVNGRTSVSYIPDAGFAGIDTFTYVVSDGDGGSATATVRVAVSAPNALPMARDDSGATDEGTTVVLAVLANDLDPDGDALRVEAVGRPSMGRAWHDGMSVVYRPYVGTSGVDTFTYTVSDGRGGTATATVLVAVLAVNDPPLAQDDSATTDKDIPVRISVLANDTDDGEGLVIRSIGSARHGTLTMTDEGLVYSPEPGFVGTDTFVYVIADAEGLTSEATVTVGVAEVAGGGGAASVGCEARVILNEIAWAGSAADAGDEWIELRNLGTSPVDLTGWTVQWRRTRPASSDEAAWKVVELSGVLEGASVSACDTQPEDVSMSRSDAESGAWSLTYTRQQAPGYFLLERTKDTAVYDVAGDIFYDAGRSPVYSLSDAGEVVLLVDATGTIVDTANASNVGRDAWAAGSADTYGSMERIDPLGPDVPENWSTNVGVVAFGQDAQKHPLRATPGALNAPSLEALYAELSATPVQVAAGEPLVMSFTLSRETRRATGWPWIVATRPGLANVAGAGGETSSCAFSGQSQSGTDAYRLEISTGDAAPGMHAFWVAYGAGKGILMPVLITP